MAIGFDFGTASCSVAQVVNNRVKGIPLSGEDLYIPSTLCAPSREVVSEYLFTHFNISPLSEIGEQLMRSSMNANIREKIDIARDDVRFGERATALYLEDPSEYYYVKSPKSFLGLLGLDEIRYAIFEDIICAMMANVKRSAESHLDKEITETVIGRPITFHQRGGEKSNQQAEGILHRAAQRAGFKHIEFQFEPVAAGLEYEASLQSEKNVLVVDIGGGTSDCSLIKMGPKWVGKSQRTETLLGHAGSFTGGNDFDIHLANRSFMPEFGKNTDYKNGLPVPNTPFWDSIAINDVIAQRNFYSKSNYRELVNLQRGAVESDKLARIMDVYNNTLGYSIVAEAERTKIALSGNTEYEATLSLSDEDLIIPMSVEQMETSIQTPLRKIKKLVSETINQAQDKPEEIFITGGSARSPIIRQAITSVVGDIPIANGDYFGSVTSGLARWADLCFS